jgi:hypothetical protein
MKMTRKLIPALAMLLVSAVMLSTASFAWLASNKTVTAGSMTVQANTDVVYMQISKDNSESSWGITAIADNATSGKLELVNAQVDVDEVTWRTAVAGSTSAATQSGGYTDVTTAATSTDSGVNKYTLINDFYVKMYGDYSLENLRISGVSLGNGESIATDAFDEALRVLVVASNVAGDTVHGIQIWDLGTKTFLTGSGATPLAEDVTDEVIKLTVYIYYDGEDARAFTDNLNTTAAKSLTVSFTADEPTA